MLCAMSKLPGSEDIANENVSVENQVPVTPEGATEENVVVNQVEVVTEEETVAKPISEAIAEVAEEKSEPEASAAPAPEEEKTVEAEVVDTTVTQDFEISSLSKAQLVEKLAETINEEISEEVKNKVDALKQAFYKLKKIATDKLRKDAESTEEAPEDEANVEVDEDEQKLKELLAIFREKKSSLVAQSEKIKENNLVLKKEIIEKLKELIDSQDDFYKVYNEFRKLQQKWKEIKQVPQIAVNDLWKDYQLYSEKFYDLLKINNEMRDYDFKKNLEMKLALCESVEKLENEKDIISAFYQLQKLHQEWREIGPVAKELREEIWARFKKASSVINKKHQDHFESLRALEQRNLAEKTVLCEEVESINYDGLTSFKGWDAQNKHVIELQDKWKTIGFAPKKHNVKIFERFRTACDTFFKRKSEFYKEIKETMDVNLEKKKALCEKAEALKESEDWKETSNQLIDLQKEWKTVGLVSRKFSDALWKRFIGACDYFFERKNKYFSSQKSEETANLKAKKDIIEKVKAIDTNLPASEAVAIIRELIAEWNKIGFVPFREKDKTYKEYRAEIDKHFDRLKIDESERRLQSFKSNMSEISSSGEKSKNKLLNEREKLMRTYDRLKSDIQVYENNIGFLSVSSKGGGGLVKDMNRKIESLKEELNLIVKKIDVIDENFEQK
ncbi:hypothetical protein FACS1894160_2960 [Bacteroidia bacterium]|nr:hypothetical protein FACS1894160_2960 [Bacteroidia bacterium]